MGAKTTKQGSGDNGNNLVTRFTISDESGPALSIDQVNQAKFCQPRFRMIHNYFFSPYANQFLNFAQIISIEIEIMPVILREIFTDL